MCQNQTYHATPSPRSFSLPKAVGDPVASMPMTKFKLLDDLAERPGGKFRRPGKAAGPHTGCRIRFVQGEDFRPGRERRMN
jgi:hypothetical protein